jgi:hypothetical protein
MDDELVEVYRAKSDADAHFLRNRLEDNGIRAEVFNSMLERGMWQGEYCWATAARVMVLSRDAAKAREIAAEHDSLPRLPGSELDSAANPPWFADGPVCPQCDEPRKTFCPVCHTSGTEFTMADSGYSVVPELDADSGPMSCGCGSCGCGSGHETHDEGASETDEPPPVLLLCLTCDEAFEPQYLRRCEWCGHEFDDGVEPPEEASDEPPDSTSPAATLLLAVAVLAGIAIFVWLLGMGH